MKSNLLQHKVIIRINITNEGIQALLKISNGDMRRVLNILQATSVFSLVDENVIYQCTGSPHPMDIEAAMASILSEDFGSCYSCIFFSLN